MKMLKKTALWFIAVILVMTAIPMYTNAKVLYMPDVTPEMSKASYWSDKMNVSDKVLADNEGIAAINAAIVNGSGTNVVDLEQWSADHAVFDAEEMGTSLAAAALADCEYFWNHGVQYKEDGTKYASYKEAREEFFDAIIANCDDDAVGEKESQLAICTKRTNILSLPTDKPLMDDATDPDFDYLYQTMLRVNEPVVLQASSKDGQYYSAKSSCTSGWIDKDDVAVCSSREQWLSAWHMDPDDVLVVYDDKIYTEESNVTPSVSSVKLPMGTCLKLASEAECEGQINYRTAHNNHVVWLPTRDETGSYAPKLCLIGENRKVNEGYLPLTSANIVMVAMNQLGDAYGWGGMLGSEDCSGYVRDVYKCFGLELARNTTWQAAQPVKKLDLSEMDDELKTEMISRLPVGSILIFNGHEMLYLGKDNEKLYVISSVSHLVFEVDTAAQRVRGTVINTLDMRRGRLYQYHTWLRELHTAEVPYLPLDTKKEMSDPEISIEPISSYTYNGSAKKPKVVVHDNAGTLVQGDEYTVSYSNNINAGTAAVTVSAAEGSEMYAGSVTLPFTISKAAQKLSVTKRAKTVKRSKVRRKKQTVKKALSVKKTPGRIIYKKTGGSGRLTVNARTGAVTVKKGTRRGRYKIKIRVTAKETANYLPAVKTVTVSVRVK